MDQLISVLIGAAGPTGALVWFMYHTTTNTIPNLVEDQRKEMAALVESFRTDLREERVLRETLLREVLDRASDACPLKEQRHGHT
jgi:hypothetical protein